MTTTGLDPRYDDANNPDWYCVHGQYTGSPWGGDFLCGMCESGQTERITCGDCDFARWGEHGEKFVTCEPNAERDEEAQDFHAMRKEFMARGDYAKHRKWLRDALSRSRAETPKRVHTYLHAKDMWHNEDEYTTGKIYHNRKRI
jgi:hypothetical protein